MARTGDKTILPEVIGLPPWNLISETNEQLINSMPIAQIAPHRPVFKLGFDLFSLAPDWDLYLQMLSNHGFEVYDSSKKYLKIAFIADAFPTDSFQNEYGENFLQSMSEVISEKGASIAQFFGAESASDVLEIMARGVGQGAKGINKGFGDIISKVGGGITQGASAMKEALRSSGRLGANAARGLDYVDRLLAGARIDFPNVWKTSSFTPSYTMTVRLYNPNPRDTQSTKKYIVGPIVALMLLGIPRSQDGFTYRWPFLHKIKSEGIYNLDPAFISNVTVIKGGDQQQISFNQRMGIADVRIDFGSLYSTIVAEQSARFKSGRPTLRSYIDGMDGKRVVANRDGDRLDTASTETTVSRAPGVEESDPSNPPSRTSSSSQESAIRNANSAQGGLSARQTLTGV